MKMGKFSRKEIISDLPQGIIDSILTKLPIRDAVRTSILSTKWRHQWTTMTQLAFDDDCVCFREGEEDAEKELVNFIMRFLLRHDGPIHKFKLSTSYLKSTTDTEQWLLYLSRKKDLKELNLDVYRPDWWCTDQSFPTPSCIFSCQKLTRLELFSCELKPPLGFQGFPCLKYLALHCNRYTLKVIEDLISGCPLLEEFEFVNNFEPLALTVRAPNLKHLNLYGTFIDIYLEHTPLLVAISMHFSLEAWEGNVLTKVPVTYDCLMFIELEHMNFEEMNQVLYVLHLILQSFNLHEPKILAPTIESYNFKDADLDFWEKESPADYTFKHLKKVEMSGVLRECDMEFLKFVLGCSPVLEVMRVSSHKNDSEKLNMANVVLHFRRASSIVDMQFFD